MPILKQAEEILTLVLSQRRTALGRSPTSSTCPVSIKRSFTWGTRHKWRNSHHCKNISEKVNKAIISKSGLRYPYLDRQMFVRRFLPAQGWHFASHWKNSRIVLDKKDDREHNSPGSQQKSEVEDWRSMWERQQKEKYVAFKKKIDQDPFSALFGKSNSWLGWFTETTAAGAAKSEGQANVLKKKAEEYLKNDKARKAMKDTNHPMTMEEYAKSSSQHPSGRASVNEEAEQEDYEIDPITLRKVPKNTKPTAPSKKDTVKYNQKSFEVPIKIFKPSPRTANMPAKGTSATQVDDWLGREGFGSTQEAHKPMFPSEYGTSVKSKMPGKKIESALDRHLQEKISDSKKYETTPKSGPKENKDEDIDLLRASDIRASAGKGGQPAKESDLARDARRQALEDRYERQQQWLKEEMKRDEHHLKDLEILRKNAVDGSSAGLSAVSKAIKDINDRYLNELLSVSAYTGKPSIVYATPASEVVKAEKLSSFVTNRTLQIQSKIVPLKTQIDLMTVEYEALRQGWLLETRRLKAKKVAKLHEEEIQAQKTAMEAAEMYRGEGDVAHNVHLFAPKKAAGLSKAMEASAANHGGEGDISPDVVQFASRDRWYKRKAPHANCEMDIKLERLTKDKELVREVRRIYEDTYGVIDTKHRQEEIRGEGDMSPNVVDFASRDRWYKRKTPVLTDSVVASKGETGTDKAYMMLKEDPSAELLTKNATDARLRSSIPKIEQQSTPRQDQPCTAAATALQIAELKAQLDKQAAQLQTHREEIQFLRENEAAKSDYNIGTKETVRRTEPVFSGRKNKEKKRATHRRKTLKHVLLTGAVTAGLCYATGLAIELMKVNGL